MLMCVHCTALHCTIDGRYRLVILSKMHPLLQHQHMTPATITCRCRQAVAQQLLAMGLQELLWWSAAGAGQLYMLPVSAACTQSCRALRLHCFGTTPTSQTGCLDGAPLSPSGVSRVGLAQRRGCATGVEAAAAFACRQSGVEGRERGRGAHVFPLAGSSSRGLGLQTNWLPGEGPVTGQLPKAWSASNLDGKALSALHVGCVNVGNICMLLSPAGRIHIPGRAELSY